MLVFVLVFLVSWQPGSGQRYAQRNPIPVPIEDSYDEYYSEAYDFSEKKEVYRWNVNDFPNPQENFRFCNRMKASFVCDPDMILEREQADKLDANIKQLYEETPCICDNCEKQKGGIVIGIALLKNVFQPYNEHSSQIIRSFSERLRMKWQLGKCDNDILIVVVTDDRMSYTDVAKATSAYVSLKEAYRIFLENKFHFSAGHFYEGLNHMLTDYYEMTRNMKRPVNDKINVPVVVGSIFGTVILLAIIMLILVLLYRRLKKPPAKAVDEVDKKPEGVASSWKKQDIKVLFGSLKSSNSSQSNNYQECATEDNSTATTYRIEEVDETTPSLADHHPQLTEVTQLSNTSSSPSELLDKDLDKAVETLTETFKPKFNRHETDL